MPRIQCSHPGCRTIIDKAKGTRCDKHAEYVAPPRKRYEHHYDANGHFIYSTKRWKMLSKKLLTIFPFCAKCLLEGRHTPADIVDHIEEIIDTPERAYDAKNLECLCHTCHNRKTAQAKRNREQKAFAQKQQLYTP